MTRSTRLMTAGIAGLMLAGCRTATTVVEVPRVDLEVSGGNRGYLIGSPSSATAAPRDTTRQMIETEIELPTTVTPPPRSPRPVGLDQIAPPEIDLSQPPATTGTSVPTTHDLYVVKKGDTLWSIAADPQIYGDATKWRRIAEANRDVLKSPDRVRAGMTLRIPRDGGGTSPVTTTSPTESTTYAK